LESPTPSAAQQAEHRAWHLATAAGMRLLAAARATGLDTPFTPELMHAAIEYARADAAHQAAHDAADQETLPHV